MPKTTPANPFALRLPLRPVKAEVRPDVSRTIARGIARLPVLGQANPEAACLAVDLIDSWIGNDGPAPEPQTSDALTLDAVVEDESTYASMAYALGEDPITWLRWAKNPLRKVS